MKRILLLVLLCGCTAAPTINIERLSPIPQHLEHVNGMSLTGYRWTRCRMAAKINTATFMYINVVPTDNTDIDEEALPDGVSLEIDKVATAKIGLITFRDLEDYQNAQDASRWSGIGLGISISF